MLPNALYTTCPIPTASMGSTNVLNKRMWCYPIPLVRSTTATTKKPFSISGGKQGEEHKGRKIMKKKTTLLLKS